MQCDECDVALSVWVRVLCCVQVWDWNYDPQALLRANRGALENAYNRRTKAMSEMSIGDFFASMKVSCKCACVPACPYTCWCANVRHVRGACMRVRVVSCTTHKCVPAFTPPGSEARRHHALSRTAHTHLLQLKFRGGRGRMHECHCKSLYDSMLKLMQPLQINRFITMLCANMISGNTVHAHFPFSWFSCCVCMAGTHME